MKSMLRSSYFVVGILCGIALSTVKNAEKPVQVQEATVLNCDVNYAATPQSFICTGDYSLKIKADRFEEIGVGNGVDLETPSNPEEPFSVPPTGVAGLQ